MKKTNVIHNQCKLRPVTSAVDSGVHGFSYYYVFCGTGKADRPASGLFGDGRLPAMRCEVSRNVACPVAVLHGALD